MLKRPRMHLKTEAASSRNSDLDWNNNEVSSVSRFCKYSTDHQNSLILNTSKPIQMSSNLVTSLSMNMTNVIVEFGRDDKFWLLSVNLCRSFGLGSTKPVINLPSSSSIPSPRGQRQAILENLVRGVVIEGFKLEQFVDFFTFNDQNSHEIQRRHCQGFGTVKYRFLDNNSDSSINAWLLFTWILRPWNSKCVGIFLRWNIMKYSNII